MSTSERLTLLLPSIVVAGSIRFCDQRSTSERLTLFQAASLLKSSGFVTNKAKGHQTAALFVVYYLMIAYHGPTTTTNSFGWGMNNDHVILGMPFHFWTLVVPGRKAAIPLFFSNKLRITSLAKSRLVDCCCCRRRPSIQQYHSSQSKASNQKHPRMHCDIPNYKCIFFVPCADPPLLAANNSRLDRFRSSQSCIHKY